MKFLKNIFKKNIREDKSKKEDIKKSKEEIKQESKENPRPEESPQVDYNKNYERPETYKKAAIKKHIDKAKENNPDANTVETNIVDIKISPDLETNISKLEDAFENCMDVIFKDFLIGENLDIKLTLVYMDGLVNVDLVADNVTRPLMEDAKQARPKNVIENIYETIKKANISATDIQDLGYLEKAIDSILSGDTVLFVDGYEKAIVISSRGWEMRGLQEPQSEALVRGPRDGFNETLKTGITLVRRRVKDTKLKVEMIKIGRRSKTDIAILYIDDIVDKTILKEVKQRLARIDTDSIMESGDIEGFIEDDNYSIFPQIQSTERPDTVATSLYEGRISILVDNTPFALILPMTLNAMFLSAEDYYERWVATLIVRPIRYLAAATATLAPAFYIAVTSFHPGVLPTKLALHIAASRSMVPFPAFLEAFLMIMTVEFLRESGTRISGPIGTTIGVVGGLVIGQSAVEAGLVAPLMVIITALTTVSIFMIPNYSFNISLRIINFIMMILASVLGLYGIVLGLIAIGIHLCSITCCGLPYFSPFGILGKQTSDLKDSIIRVPIGKMKKRPHYGYLKDQMRTSEHTRED